MRQKAQNPNTDHQWFTGKIADRKLSVRKIAKLMNLDPSTVSLLLRGVRKVSYEELVQLSEILGVTVAQATKAFGLPVADQQQQVLKTIESLAISGLGSDKHDGAEQALQKILGLIWGK